MSFLIAIVARLGVPQPLQRLAAGFAGVVGLIALLAALWALHSHWQRSAYNRAFNAGWTALAKLDAAAVEKARKVNVVATATADSERAADTKTITDDKEARDAAIKTAPAAVTGDATRAANCVRWQRAHPGREAPAACR